jgi:hypothetical protein
MSANEQLPALVDCKGLMEELGVARATAEAIMRQLEIVTFPDLRKTFVKRADVHRLIAERTFNKDQVAA